MEIINEVTLVAVADQPRDGLYVAIRGGEQLDCRGDAHREQVLAKAYACAAREDSAEVLGRDVQALAN